MMSDLKQHDAVQTNEQPSSLESAVDEGKNKKIAILIMFGCCLVVALSIYLVASLKGSRQQEDILFNYQSLESGYGQSGIPEASESEDVLHIDVAQEASESFVLQAELVTALESEVVALTVAVETLQSSMNEVINHVRENQRMLAVHMKSLEEQNGLYRQQNELVREGLRTGTMNHQLIRQIGEQVAAIDENISSEFARFPVFVWSVSSWAGQLYVTVSHADAPRNISELAEGEVFHGWKVEHLSSQRVIFRNSETLHEVTL